MYYFICYQLLIQIRKIFDITFSGHSISKCDKCNKCFIFFFINMKENNFIWTFLLAVRMLLSHRWGWTIRYIELTFPWKKLLFLSTIINPHHNIKKKSDLWKWLFIFLLHENWQPSSSKYFWKKHWVVGKKGLKEAWNLST